VTGIASFSLKNCNSRLPREQKHTLESRLIRFNLESNLHACGVRWHILERSSVIPFSKEHRDTLSSLIVCFCVEDMNVSFLFGNSR
jgi:hypothetical protein